VINSVKGAKRDYAGHVGKSMKNGLHCASNNSVPCRVKHGDRRLLKDYTFIVCLGRVGITFYAYSCELLIGILHRNSAAHAATACARI
jgi:hypothetical protein